MPTIYVAASKTLQAWGSDIGISKHIYKVGLTEDAKADMAKAMNEATALGQNDWKIIAKRDVPELSGEDEMLARLALRLKMIDPTYYPKLKGTRSVFKVNPFDVESYMVIKQTMAGEQPKVTKLKPADIGNYLIENALR
ncbi:MAG: hypothetical protein EXR11_12450 [Rhodospirillaceae bacterium]|nr:hypothetical protein [Rhodospirillaceae bacterium]